MPTFFYPWLAVAGAAAASVPVVLHLLNRRRYRVVQWAAMDFLREALSRSRRIMELRDLLLLLVRVACLLAFGFALARPYWSRAAQALADPNQPVHAVVLLDNSLSMSYQNGDGMLLDTAKARAKEFIQGLPAGSIISVIPTCGTPADVRYEAYSRTDDAVDALTAIRPVDRAARSGPVIDLALEACRRTTSMPARRICLVTDQQVEKWSAEAELEHLKQLPAPMQVIEVKADEIENVSVSSVELRDGLASAQSPVAFVAKVHYEGREPRKNITVALTVDGKPASTQTVNLQPGQSPEVTFPDYVFPPSGKAGQMRPAAVEVAIAPESIPFDRLPGDNRRSLVVPVADSLPVVFVDSQGDREDAKARGDTWWLRRWLAPPASRSAKEHPLVQSRHITMGRLDVKMLSDARLVVIAGVAQPTAAQVALLRDYVEQGGKLILAAGGNFDPAAWTELAWKDGLGILPAPLAPRAVGHVRDEWNAQSGAAPLTLDVAQLSGRYFRPEGVSDEELRNILGPPVVFLKTVVATLDDNVKDRVAKSAADYFARQRAKLTAIDRQLADLQSSPGGSGQAQITDLEKQRAEIEPSWLTWKQAGLAGAGDELSVNDLAPRALAFYNNKSPMLLRRRWGRGEVLFLTTSLSRDWTTMHELPQSAWVMDRLARLLLADTLPSWNTDGERAAVLPISVADRSLQYVVVDPEGRRKDLTVDALVGDRYGIALSGLTERGIYRVEAVRTDAPPSDSSRVRTVPIAVNGPADESQLAPQRQSGAAGGEQSFVDASAQTYSVLAIELQGVDLWKLLLGGMLVLLLAECLLAARSRPRTEAAA